MGGYMPSSSLNFIHTFDEDCEPGTLLLLCRKHLAPYHGFDAELHAKTYMTWVVSQEVSQKTFFEVRYSRHLCLHGCMQVSIWVHEWALEQREEGMQVSLQDDFPKLKAPLGQSSMPGCSSWEWQCWGFVAMIIPLTLHPTHLRTSYWSSSFQSALWHNIEFIC